ncbi:hypothetical protein [Methanobrevibacter smithii]|jgi:hypothetical protein|uniref:hypothetical protein n=1 Tax=Methanobrevibacter smithii TaxID=2173 RepID=UPI0037DCEE2C
MKIFEMSYDSAYFTDSEKLPKKIDGYYYDIMGDKDDINFSNPSFVGDIILGVKGYSEKWLFNVCGEKLYLAPVFRSEIYDKSLAKGFYNNSENQFSLKDLIRKNFKEIDEFIKAHYLEFDVVCSFSEDLYVRINSEYQGNLFRKILIKCNDPAEEWFYQITHWDGWFSILIEPFAEFTEDNLFKKTPLKLNVVNHHHEIKDKIMEAYEFDFESRRHAKKGDALIGKHKNKISSFKFDNLEITVNPDGGDFDYETLFDSQTKIRRYAKSGSDCIYVTHYKIDTQKNNQTRIIVNNNVAESLIQFKSRSIKNQISNNKIKKQDSKSTINKLLEDYKEDILVTIVGGFNNEDLLKKGSIFKIVKEPDNLYDMEAIAVKYDDETIAYVANSVTTVERGTMSAGRIYDKFNNDCEIEIIFAGYQIIAKLLIA